MGPRPTNNNEKRAAFVGPPLVAGAGFTRLFLPDMFFNKSGSFSRSLFSRWKLTHGFASESLQRDHHQHHIDHRQHRDDNRRRDMRILRRERPAQPFARVHQRIDQHQLLQNRKALKRLPPFASLLLRLNPPPNAAPRAAIGGGDVYTLRRSLVRIPTPISLPPSASQRFDSVFEASPRR
jgi:hypothetical protein